MLQFLLLCWSEPATTPASHPVLSLSLRARSFVHFPTTRARERLWDWIRQCAMSYKITNWPSNNNAAAVAALLSFQKTRFVPNYKPSAPYSYTPSTAIVAINTPIGQRTRRGNSSALYPFHHIIRQGISLTWKTTRTIGEWARGKKAPVQRAVGFTWCRTFCSASVW